MKPHFHMQLVLTKINRNYLNYYLENESYIFDDRNPKSEIFLKHSKKFPVKRIP